MNPPSRALHPFSPTIMHLATTAISILVIILLASPADAFTLPGSSRQCPVLVLNSSGPCVSALQKELDNLGIKPAVKVDGHFGPDTRNAVENYQKKMGLKVDGMAGWKTAQQLSDSSGKSNSPPGNSTKESPQRMGASAASSNQPWQTQLIPHTLLGFFAELAPIIVLLLFIYFILTHKRTKELDIRILWIMRIKLTQRPSQDELRAELAKKYLESQNQQLPPSDFFGSIGSGDS